MSAQLREQSVQRLVERVERVGVALALGALQRFAHRRAADAEQLRQLVLGEAAPRLELGGDDRSAQRGVHLVAGGQPVDAVLQGDTHLWRLVYKCGATPRWG
jgi:hypothetical protein